MKNTIALVFLLLNTGLVWAIDTVPLPDAVQTTQTQARTGNPSPAIGTWPTPERPATPAIGTWPTPERPIALPGGRNGQVNPVPAR